MKKVILAGLVVGSVLFLGSCGEGGSESGVPDEAKVNDLTFTTEEGKEVKLENAKEGTAMSMTMEGRENRTDIDIKGDNGTIKLGFNFTTKEIKPGEYPVAKGIDFEEGKKGLLLYYVKFDDGADGNCCGRVNEFTSSGTVNITHASETELAGELIDVIGWDSTVLRGKFYTTVTQRDY